MKDDKLQTERPAVTEERWIRIKAAKDALGDQFRVAYSSAGIVRFKWFWSLATAGWREGLWSFAGMCKLMVFGCLLNRRVKF